MGSVGPDVGANPTPGAGAGVGPNTTLGGTGLGSGMSPVGQDTNATPSLGIGQNSSGASGTLGTTTGTTTGADTNTAVGTNAGGGTTATRRNARRATNALGSGRVNTAPGSDINPMLGTGVAPGSGVTGTDLSTTGSVSGVDGLDISGSGEVTLHQLQLATRGRSAEQRTRILGRLTDIQRQGLRAECQSAGKQGRAQVLCRSVMRQ